MNNKAYTLTEIIIAIVIISLTGMLLVSGGVFMTRTLNYAKNNVYTTLKNNSMIDINGGEIIIGSHPNIIINTVNGAKTIDNLDYKYKSYGTRTWYRK